MLASRLRKSKDLNDFLVVGPPGWSSGEAADLVEGVHEHAKKIMHLATMLCSNNNIILDTRKLLNRGNSFKTYRRHKDSA